MYIKITCSKKKKKCLFCRLRDKHIAITSYVSQLKYLVAFGRRCHKKSNFSTFRLAIRYRAYNVFTLTNRSELDEEDEQR